MHSRSIISISTILSTLTLSLALTGCSDSSNQQSPPTNPSPDAAQIEPMTITTTIGMITDPTKFIVGDQAQVTGLIGSGIDPHLYKPTRTDITTLMESDIVLYNGLMLEGRMTDALVRIASAGTTVRAITESIDEESLLSPPDFEGHHDPHLWMDPLAWEQAVAVITDTLTNASPTNAETFTKNAENYQSQIRDLHTYAQQALGSIPESQRVLVTAHDAFNYFGQRYNMEVLGIQGISTESEAGVRDIERIVSLLVDKQIKAVFVETTVSDRNINALIAGAKAQGHDVVIGGSLYSDAMGQPGTYEGTYIGMLDHNITTIARALGGDAPEKGMNGKLTYQDHP